MHPWVSLLDIHITPDSQMLQEPRGPQPTWDAGVVNNVVTTADPECSNGQAGQAYKQSRHHGERSQEFRVPLRMGCRRLVCWGQSQGLD